MKTLRQQYFQKHWRVESFEVENLGAKKLELIITSIQITSAPTWVVPIIFTPTGITSFFYRQLDKQWFGRLFGITTNIVVEFNGLRIQYFFYNNITGTYLRVISTYTFSGTLIPFSTWSISNTNIYLCIKCPSVTITWSALITSKCDT